MSKNLVTNGKYLRFSERDNYLRIYLRPAGRELIRDFRVKRGVYNQTDIYIFMELMEDLFGDGWQNVLPKQVGDMRDANWLVISNDYTTPDDSLDTLIVGKAYNFSRYIFDSYIHDLVCKHYVDWNRHDYHTPEEMNEIIANLEIAQTIKDIENEFTLNRTYSTRSYTNIA